MKSALIFCGFGFLALVSAVAVPDKHIEMAKAMLKECQLKEGGSDDDFNTMITGAFADTEAAHCMVTCINEKMGLFKDGKFDKSSFVEVSKMMINNDEKLMPVVDELADECQDSVTGKERCDMGLSFQKCLHRGIKDRNIDVNFF